MKKKKNFARLKNLTTFYNKNMAINDCPRTSNKQNIIRPVRSGGSFFFVLLVCC